MFLAELISISEVFTLQATGWVKKMSVSNKGTFLTHGHFFDSPCIFYPSVNKDIFCPDNRFNPAVGRVIKSCISKPLTSWLCNSFL